MAKGANVTGKPFTTFVASIVACSVLWLVGCDASDPKVTGVDTTASEPDLAIFAGCYTVGYAEPAQIRVSERDGEWIMQMKEPASAQRVWDDPEVLEVVNKEEIPKFFSIDPDNVDAIIARPDRVLVLAHVKSAYANIDPLLDSEYLSYIYRGANTIYRVECDEVNTDILADPHANIVIDNVNESI